MGQDEENEARPSGTTQEEEVHVKEPHIIKGRGQEDKEPQMNQDQGQEQMEITLVTKVE